MKKSTGELLDMIKKSPTFPNYLEQISKDDMADSSLSEYLNQLLKEKGLRKRDVTSGCGYDGGYCYDIIAGRREKPDRDKVLAICFAMKLSIEETQQLLKTTGYPPLYARTERDSAILYALQNHLSVMDTNDLLYEMKLPVLK